MKSVSQKIELVRSGLGVVFRKSVEIRQKIAALYEAFRAEFKSRAQAPGSLCLLVREDCDPADLYWAIYKGPSGAPPGARATNFRRVGIRLTAGAIYAARMGAARERLWWFDAAAARLREERKRLAADVETLRRVAAKYASRES